MQLYILFQAPDPSDEDLMPWVIDATDEYTIENNGDVPEDYAAKRKLTGVKEMIVSIPDKAVLSLFKTPQVTGTVVEPE